MKINKTIVSFIMLFAVFCSLLYGTFTAITTAHAQEEKNITVSAEVPPNQSDFQYSIAATDNKTTVAQNETLSYQITYSAHASAGVATTTTIVADWNNAKAPDGSHIVDYALGSASDGYGNTTPVVDLAKRTITWTINSLPAGATNQKITFILKTNTNDTNPAHIPFTIKADMSNQYLSLNEQTVSQIYAYHQVSITQHIALTPTTTPTSIIKTPPAAAVIANPTLTFLAVPKKTLSISDVSLKEISQSSAAITVRTSKPTALWLKLGISPHTLLDSQAILQRSTSNTVTLNGLSPATTYYVQLALVTDDGQKKTSEIFSFKTASPSQMPNLEKNVVVITNNGEILVSDVKDKDLTTTSLALLTIGSDYEFTYRLKNRIALKSIDVVVRNKVLGINTLAYTQEPSTFTIPMIEKEPSVYVATLKTFLPGAFEMFVNIVDANGNITEQKIAEVKVMQHLSVFDADTQNPLADARISLLYYNIQTHTFEHQSRTLFKRIPNPVYTDMHGEVALNLPQGKYRAQVSAFGYDEKTVDFVLGAKTGEEFPQIPLHKNLLSVTNVTRYYQNSLVDFLSHFNRFLNSLSLSLRFFNLIASVVVTSFIFISFLLFTMRTHIRFTHIPAFFFHNIEKFLQKTNSTYLAGTVIDEQNNPLTRVHIACLDPQTGKVLAHLDTNKVGKFYLRKSIGRAVKLVTTKDGYLQHVLLFNPRGDQLKETLQIIMQSGIKYRRSVLAVVLEQMGNIAGLFFEFVLVFTVIIECFFFSLFTFALTLPFFVLSLFNVTLWLFFIREHFEQKFAK